MTTAALIIIGGPGSCSPGGGPITLSPSNARAFDQKWESFTALLESGSAASVTFSESEVTSRADQFVNEQKDGVFQDIRVCFHEGYGQASGKLAALGIEVEVRLKGSIDFSQSPALADIQEIELGSVPGFMIDLAEVAGADANNAVNKILAELNITRSYTLTFSEGEIQIEGQP